MGRRSASTGKAGSGRRRTIAPRCCAALPQADQELHAVLDTIDYGILFMGPDLRAKLINRAFRKMWDISDEFIRETRPTMRDLVTHVWGKNLYDVPEDEFEEYVEKRIQAVRKGDASVTEMRLRDGRVIQFQTRPLPDGGRMLTYFDITDLKRSEENATRARDLAETALADLSARDHELHAVLDTIDYGILFMDPDLRGKLINRAFRNMWDISDEFIRETRPTMRDIVAHVWDKNLYDVPADQFEQYVAKRIQAVCTGTAASITEMRLRDGRVIQFQTRPLPDGGHLLTYFDITDLKRSEEAATKARDLAEAALAELKIAQDRLVQTEKLASLGQLTAGIAHEIKNPLNFVNNFSALSAELTDELNDLLKSADLAGDKQKDVDELTALLKDNLGKVVQHGKRADSIVKNMLLHSRERTGDRRSTDVNALVGESLNLAYHSARAEDASFSITLKHDLDPQVGAVELYPQEITRALLNLISNGFYAANKRRVEATDNEVFAPVLRAATRNLGKAVEIRIRDNGTGIPPEVREKMFTPFFTTKPTGEGTGLGLSMTHDIIVKQHGGRIDVETEPGMFTEFIIILPRGNDTVVDQKQQ